MAGIWRFNLKFYCDSYHKHINVRKKAGTDTVDMFTLLLTMFIVFLIRSNNALLHEHCIFLHNRAYVLLLAFVCLHVLATYRYVSACVLWSWYLYADAYSNAH